MEYMSDTGKEMGILSTYIYGESNIWSTCRIQEKEMGILSTEIYGESNMWSTCQIQEEIWEF